MSKNTCGDCAVEPGLPHEDGCDVARCTECGFQRISCSHEDSDIGWGSIWTGTWPGEKECVEWGYWAVFTNKGWVRSSKDDPNAVPDLNRLHYYALSGIIRWNVEDQKWQMNS